MFDASLSALSAHRLSVLGNQLSRDASRNRKNDASNTTSGLAPGNFCERLRDLFLLGSDFGSPCFIFDLRLFDGLNRFLQRLASLSEYPNV